MQQGRRRDPPCRSGATTLDSFEFNKIAGAVLASCVILLGVSIGSDEMFKPEKPAKQSYIVQGVEADATATAAAPAEPDKPIEFYLASASAEKGEAVFKKCGACHNAAKGGPAGIGPNLYGIVGNVHAHMPGFGYSDALAAMKGKPWNWDELNKWLTSPKAYVAGNKMSFAGISKPEDRAAVLVYLNTQSDKPLPIPAAPAETAAEAPAATPAA
jgi:cytochrome c